MRKGQTHPQCRGPAMSFTRAAMTIRYGRLCRLVAASMVVSSECLSGVLLLRGNAFHRKARLITGVMQAVPIRLLTLQSLLPQLRTNEG